MSERSATQWLACDRAPSEVLSRDLRGAVLDARLARATWSQGDFGLAAARGARGVLLELEDATATGHDLVHGAGSHALALAMLRAARAAGFEVAVTTTVTRSSARSASALAELLVEARVLAWQLALVAPHDAHEAAARSPSLGVCVPHVLRAADRADRAAVEVFFEAFPLCVLGPLGRWRDARAHQPAAGAPCEACAARTECPGLSPLHRARFGARELRPISPTPQAPDTARRSLAASLLAPSSRTSAD